MNNEVKLIITDFDGTLVDTFKANFLAYKEVLNKFNINLSETKYTDCFGLRFAEFMNEIKVFDQDIINKIKEQKEIIYPKYFELIKLNTTLFEFIKMFRLSGRKTAIASTAKKENVLNVLNYFNITDFFDLIITGEDALKSKPSPECYEIIIKYFKFEPNNTLIFEDSQIGIKAAQDSEANYIIIDNSYYGN